METGLPVVGSLAAVEPRAALRRDKPLSAGMLGSWRSLILGSGPSGPGLGLLVALQKIASAEGLQFPPVPAGWLRPLQTKDGNYSLGGGNSPGDVQVTYDAVALGAPLTGSASATAALDEMPQGWIATVSAPTVLSTFDAVFAESLCGIIPHDTAMRRQVAAWLTSVNNMPADDMGRLCWMAHAYGVQISMIQRQLMASSFTGAIESVLNSPSAVPLIGSVVEDAANCDMKLGQLLRDRADAYLANARISTIPAAFSVASAARTLNDLSELSRAKEEVSQLRAGNGYRASAAVKGPDLISTSYGYEISGLPSMANRLRILSDYRTAWGPALLPTSGSGASASNQPTVDLASLAYGLMIVTGSSPTVPLI
jgi:hypothetical protein